MIGALVSLIVGIVGAIVGLVGGVIGLVVGIIVPLIVGIVVPLVVIALPLLVIMGIVKVLTLGSDRCERERAPADTRMMQEINRGLARMELRLDSLETITRDDDLRAYGAR